MSEFDRAVSDVIRSIRRDKDFIRPKGLKLFLPGGPAESGPGQTDLPFPWVTLDLDPPR